VVQRLAGFTLGQADTLRSAMSKKNKEVMAALFPRFIEGCGRNGIAANVAKDIWEKILKFSDYGFNKSHSAAYAMLSYRTAYMKANYAVEFMAAVLTSELGNAGKLAFFLRECHEMGIEVTPPDINTSGLNFTVDGARIRFGLGGIKGVGSGGAEEIMKARAQGPFKGLLDFCERVDSGLNRRVMENLTKAGAFDSFGLRRAQIFSLLDEAMQRAQQTQTDRRLGQGSLFALLAPEDSAVLQLTPPDLPEWDQRELLSYEKELLGFYVTSHPTDQFADVLQTFQIETIAELSALDDNTGTRIGGIISHIDTKRSKRDNRPWAILTLESRESEIECMVFADRYGEYAEVLKPDSLVFVEGVFSRREEENAKVIAEKILPLEQAAETLTAEVHVRLRQKDMSREKVRQLADLCRQHPGPTPVIFCLICEGGEIAFVQADDLTIANSEAFRQGLRRLAGDGVLLQKANLARPKARERRVFNRPPVEVET